MLSTYLPHSSKTRTFVPALVDKDKQLNWIKTCLPIYSFHRCDLKCFLSFKYFDLYEMFPKVTNLLVNQFTSTDGRTFYCLCTFIEILSALQNTKVKKNLNQNNNKTSDNSSIMHAAEYLRAQNGQFYIEVFTNGLGTEHHRSGSKKSQKKPSPVSLFRGYFRVGTKRARSVPATPLSRHPLEKQASKNATKKHQYPSAIPPCSADCVYIFSLLSGSRTTVIVSPCSCNECRDF